MNKSKKFTRSFYLKDLRMVDVPIYTDHLGSLASFDFPLQFGIDIKRLFVVNGTSHAVRGKHAHLSLTQILICVSGECLVKCDDGKSKKEFILNTSSKSLIIPPSIWSEQIYTKKNTSLIVLCDQKYDPDDYIRDYDKFIELK